jgi:hypothetical protein
MPSKKFKLKEWLNEETDFSDMDADEIYYAGKDWKQFDYKKGLDALIKKDKDGRWIYYAGIEWKQFDYEKGLNALIEIDKDGHWTYVAGIEWKQFEFNKGLDKLIKADRNGKWTYYAGRDWERFDYKKGLNALKKFPGYYEEALKRWPKGIEQSREEIERLKRTSVKMPSKKFKLKEWINEEGLFEELTTKPVKFSFKKENNNFYGSTFKVNKKDYTVEIEELKAREWEVNFHLIAEKGGMKSTVTRTGDANIVFATVVEIIKKFVEIKKPEKIIFCSSDNTRGRNAIYARFIKNVEKFIPNYTGTILGNEYIIKKS